ncbi:CCA tRNA nucleotidyltransferase [Pseudalkalibacillus berkeleyi]|uniref:CCA-adding enzyme n=1 Tax=Pseudalkalibacillus berkeleyi TaxID=1069813 RepID=A0ABS9GXT6_9BACL|nr:CCA tRNA nucleotidyltransferase [Pseudalkalibacillus berkeleyi]MCF6137554.1 CCA tRNA nucleotidyltransferase [Pseudalkalibacillus berkeleyi]
MSLKKAKEIIRQLHKNGHEAYIVGGVVRDQLLGRPLGDIDIATSAIPEMVQRIFEKTIPVGIEHGTVIVRMEGESFEVTTFRKEGEYEDFRHPSEVVFHDSIEKDLSRRDFTVNAMALSSDGKIIDPYSGKEDLANKLIRAVGNAEDRFQEDPLRMMRALRFISTLGFHLHQDTRLALISCGPLLKKVSVERIREEFTKLLLGRHCEQALKCIKEMRLDPFLPSGPFALTFNQVTKYDWNHLETAVERWAGLLIRIGVERPYDWLNEWKLPTILRKRISELVQIIRAEPDFSCDLTLYHYGVEQMVSASNVKRFMNEDPGVSEKHILNRYDQLSLKDRSQLAIDGNDLMDMVKRTPGPWIAEILEEIEQRVVKGEVKNTFPDIKEWINECKRPLESD